MLLYDSQINLIQAKKTYWNNNCCSKGKKYLKALMKSSVIFSSNLWKPTTGLKAEGIFMLIPTVIANGFRKLIAKKLSENICKEDMADFIAFWRRQFILYRNKKIEDPSGSS